MTTPGSPTPYGPPPGSPGSPTGTPGAAGTPAPTTTPTAGTGTGPTPTSRYTGIKGAIKAVYFAPKNARHAMTRWYDRHNVWRVVRIFPGGLITVPLLFLQGAIYMTTIGLPLTYLLAGYIQKNMADDRVRYPAAPALFDEYESCVPEIEGVEGNIALDGDTTEAVMAALEQRKDALLEERTKAVKSARSFLAGAEEAEKEGAQQRLDAAQKALDEVRYGDFTDLLEGPDERDPIVSNIITPIGGGPVLDWEPPRNAKIDRDDDVQQNGGNLYSETAGTAILKDIEVRIVNGQVFAHGTVVTSLGDDPNHPYYRVLTPGRKVIVPTNIVVAVREDGTGVVEDYSTECGYGPSGNPVIRTTSGVAGNPIPDVIFSTPDTPAEERANLPVVFSKEGPRPVTGLTVSFTELEAPPGATDFQLRSNDPVLMKPHRAGIGYLANSDGSLAAPSPSNRATQWVIAANKFDNPYRIDPDTGRRQEENNFEATHRMPTQGYYEMDVPGGDDTLVPLAEVPVFGKYQFKLDDPTTWNQITLQDHHELLLQRGFGRLDPLSDEQDVQQIQDQVHVLDGRKYLTREQYREKLEEDSDIPFVPFI